MKKTLDREPNTNASEFKPKRNAAVIAKLKMQDEFENGRDLSDTH